MWQRWEKNSKFEFPSQNAIRTSFHPLQVDAGDGDTEMQSLKSDSGKKKFEGMKPEEKYTVRQDADTTLPLYFFILILLSIGKVKLTNILEWARWSMGGP